MAQTPGLLEEIFNSTLLWPQQTLWRTYRAMTDEKVDLFSEKGLLDGAMLPIIGAFANHEHDVMPEEMFGKGLGKQLAGSILTDPLFFMTSIGSLGASSMKATAAMSNALKFKGIGDAVGKAAKAKGLTSAQYLKSTKTNNLLDVFKRFKEGKGTYQLTAEEAKKFGAGLDIADLSRPAKGMKGMDELQAVEDVLRRFGKLGEDVGEKVFGAFATEASKYQIAWGLPILQRFGVRWVPKNMHGYESWVKYLGTQTSEKVHMAHSLFPIGGQIAKLPFAKGVFDLLAGSATQLKLGWQSGGRVLTDVTRGLAGGDSPTQALKYLGDNQGFYQALAKKGVGGKVAQDFQRQLSANLDDFMRSDPMFQKALKDVGFKPPMTLDAEMVQRALSRVNELENGYLQKAILDPSIQNAFGRNIVNESGEALRLGNSDDIVKLLDPERSWQLFDEAAELGTGGIIKEDAFFELANKPGTGGDQMVNLLADAYQGGFDGAKALGAQVKHTSGRYMGANQVLSPSSHLSTGTSLTEAGKAAVESKKIIAGTSKHITGIHEKAYKFGEVLKELQNKAFRSGTSLGEYAEASMDLKEMLASSSDRVKEIGKLFMIQAQEAGKELGMNYDEFTRIFGHILEGSVLQDEIASAARFMSTGTPDDAFKAMKAVSNFQNKTLRSLKSIEKILSNQGIPNEKLLQLQKDLTKDVFKYSLWSDTAKDIAEGRSRWKVMFDGKATTKKVSYKQYGDRAYDKAVKGRLTHDLDVESLKGILPKHQMRGGIVSGELTDQNILDVLERWESGKHNRAVLGGRDREDVLNDFFATESQGSELRAFFEKHGGYASDGTPRMSWDELDNLFRKTKSVKAGKIVQHGTGQTFATEVLKSLWNKGSWVPKGATKEDAAIQLLNQWGLSFSRGASKSGETRYLVQPGESLFAGMEKAAAGGADVQGWNLIKGGDFSHGDAFASNIHVQAEWGIFAGKNSLRAGGYKSLDDLMDAAHRFIDGNLGKTREGAKSPFPFVTNVDKEFVTKTLKVGSDDLARLKDYLKNAKNAAFRGHDDNVNILQAITTPSASAGSKATFFASGTDEGASTFGQAAHAEDYNILKELQTLRGTDPRYRVLGQGEVKLEQFTEVTAPRTVNEIELLVKNHLGDKIFTQDEMSDWVYHFARTGAINDEINHFLQMHEKAGQLHTPGFQLPVEMVQDMAESIRGFNSITKGIFTNTLGKTGKTLMGTMDTVRKEILIASELTGKLTPGSPLGYMGRYLSKGNANRLDEIWGSLTNTHNNLAIRIGQRLPSRIARKADHMTLEDVNDMYFGIKRHYEVIGDPKLKEYLDEMEKVVEHLSGVPGKKYKFTPQMFEDDPLISTLNRLGEAGQETSFLSYFNKVFEAGGPRGVVTDAGETLRFNQKFIQAMKGGPVSKQGLVSVSGVPEGGVRAETVLQGANAPGLLSDLARRYPVVHYWASMWKADGEQRYLTNMLKGENPHVHVAGKGVTATHPNLIYSEIGLGEDAIEQLSKMSRTEVLENYALYKKELAAILNQYHDGGRMAVRRTEGWVSQGAVKPGAGRSKQLGDPEHVVGRGVSANDRWHEADLQRNWNTPGDDFTAGYVTADDIIFAGDQESLEFVLNSSGLKKLNRVKDYAERDHSHMVGGKVVGWFDNKNNIYTHSTDAITIKNKGRYKFIEYGKDVEKIEETPRGMIVQASDGNQFIVHGDQFDRARMSMLRLGQESYGVDNPAKAMVHSLGRAELEANLITKTEGLKDAKNMLGEFVVYGSREPILGAVRAAAQSLEVTPIAWRTFDSINYFIKSFQTVLRAPFHIANVASGIQQASLAGASPMNIAGGYMDAMRLLYSDQKFLKLHDMTISALDIPGVLSKNVKILPSTDVVAAVRRMGFRGADKLTPEQISKYGLDKVEDFMIPDGLGGMTSIGMVMQEAAKQQLFGTFSHSGLRGSQTISDTVLNTKIQALDPGIRQAWGLAPLVRKGLEGLGAAPGGGAIRESSEVFNRLGTVFALMRQGLSIERAVQMAKAGHVPYERTTPFLNGAKRVMLYATFPRHYMPWAWGQFAKNPTKIARLADTIRQQQLFTSVEGRPTLKIGDYRVDIGRLNANVEATSLLGAFFDKIGRPMVERMPYLGRPFDSYRLEKEVSTAGLAQPGGLAGILTPIRTVLPSRDHNQTGNWMDEAMRMVWPFKYAAQMIGATPDKESQSPYVDYTFMDKVITQSDFGLGQRKVRKDHEVHMAYNGFLNLFNKIKRRHAAATSRRDKDLLEENAEYLQQMMVNMMKREDIQYFS